MVAVTVLILAVCLACTGGGTSSSSSGPTSTPASVCNQATALKQSLQDLQNVNVIKNGTSALSSAAATVKTNAEALATSAHGQIKPRAEALHSSLDQLSSAITNVGSGGITPVTDALSSVRQNGNALVQSLNDLKC
jgi:hypothetical protein